MNPKPPGKIRSLSKVRLSRNKKKRKNIRVQITYVIVKEKKRKNKNVNVLKSDTRKKVNVIRNQKEFTDR